MRLARDRLGAGGSPPRNAPPGRDDAHTEGGPDAPHGPRGPALLVAEVAIGAARFVSRLVPAGVKKRVEDGIFHYVFHKTRVENDAYGWRPDTPGGGEPPPEHRGAGGSRDG